MSYRKLRYYRPSGSVFGQPKVQELRDQPHPDFSGKEKDEDLVFHVYWGKRVDQADRIDHRVGYQFLGAGRWRKTSKYLS